VANRATGQGLNSRSAESPVQPILLAGLFIISTFFHLIPCAYHGQSPDRPFFLTRMAALFKMPADGRRHSLYPARALDSQEPVPAHGRFTGFLYFIPSQIYIYFIKNCYISS
jgi:hypothetical protein